ncbi:MAG: hypothetical protein KDN05_15455 [Verrucomicrobiae bacterium]|nr:hypothetical protein [Verrucomicrobiae bacterium]
MSATVGIGSTAQSNIVDQEPELRTPLSTPDEQASPQSSQRINAAGAHSSIAPGTVCNEGSNAENHPASDEGKLKSIFYSVSSCLMTPYYLTLGSGDIFNGERKGPYDYDSLKLLWDKEILKPSDCVKNVMSNLSGEWVEVATIAPLFARIERSKIVFRVSLVLAVLGLLSWWIMDLWVNTSEYKSQYKDSSSGPPLKHVVIFMATLLGSMASGMVALASFVEIFFAKRSIGR